MERFRARAAMGPRSNGGPSSFRGQLQPLDDLSAGGSSTQDLREDIVSTSSSFRAGTLAVAAVVLASALPPACAPAKPKSAEEVVKRMSDRLSAAQAFSFATREKHQRRRGGKVVDVTGSRTFLVKRPGAVAFRTVGGAMGGGSATYDGKSLTLVWPEQKAYARVDMPPTIDAALERLEDRFNTALPVGDLIHSDAYGALVAPGMSGRYAGRETVGAVECDHVAFTHERVDWELWVAASGEPTPCRIRITTKGRSGPLTSDVAFSDWDLAATPAANAFEAQVPTDYERIKVAAYDAAEAAAPAAAPAPPAEPPAPSKP
jgi:hypothetical protein